MSTRDSTSTRIRSTAGTARSGHRRASPPVSISRWRWSRPTTAARSPRLWPAGWSCSCIARAARPSSRSRSGCRVRSRSTVRAAQDFIDNHPADDHRLDLLARRAAMSSRHFTRVFTAEVGETPARYVERVRVEAARLELETTASSLDLIATNCGFGTAESLRRAFQRRVGVAPDAYRRRFRSRATTTPRLLHAVS